MEGQHGQDRQRVQIDQGADGLLDPKNHPHSFYITPINALQVELHNIVESPGAVAFQARESSTLITHLR
jgi:hypothetical protein